jgi:hypothetical protein
MRTFERWRPGFGNLGKQSTCTGIAPLRQDQKNGGYETSDPGKLLLLSGCVSGKLPPPWGCLRDCGFNDCSASDSGNATYGAENAQADSYDGPV